MATTTSTAAKKASRRPKLEDWAKLFQKFHVWEILAFIIPFILIGLGFKKAGMHPFGENQFLVTDLWHQYYPFFQLLQEKLQHGGSLLYTWRSGMGTNFLAMMSYYAASPLNLLAFFVPKEEARTCMMVILMLKFACAGGFTAQCLRYVFGKNDPSITLFGTMYAMCSYMLGYYWNTIWIDTVALLPLVMLGLTALVREGKYRTYVISLALALISSYYIGYMVCIYVVIGFIVLCIFEGTKPKRFLKRFAVVTGASMMAGGLGAWILLPAYHALQLTHSAGNTFPTSSKWYNDWSDILANMLPFTEVTSKDGLPNLYCGMLPVLLIGAFLIAKKIRLREKIAGILVLVFLLVSCNLNYLDFIWHGFHFPNMLPYRFSFLFSFTLILMAYRAYQILLEEKLNFFQWGAMLAVGAVFLFIAYKSGVQSEDHKYIKYSAILGGVYMVILLFRLFTPKQIVQGALSLVILFEMGAQSINGVKAVGYSGYTSYPANNEDIQQLIKIRDQREDDLFSRTELTMWYTLNDPSLYYYNGLSQFSSMANESVTTFMRKIGVSASEAGNRYFYGNNTPVTNLLCDIKFIMAKDGYNGDSKYSDKIGESGPTALYRESCTPSLGYLGDLSAIFYEMSDSKNAFEQQNGVFSALTGVQEDVFTPVDITHVGHSGYEVVRNDYGDYSYTRLDDAVYDSYLKYNYTAPQDGMLYATVHVDEQDDADIYYNDVNIHRYNIGRQAYTFPLGDYTAGEMVTVRIPMKEDNKSGSCKIYVYALNHDVLEKGYEYLDQHRLHLTEFADTHFKGTVNADTGRVLYLSVPYEDGWKAYVDGKPAKLNRIFDAMCSINLEAGEHEIEMRYSPKGFVPGACTAVICLAGFVLLILMERKQKGKDAFDKDETPDPDDKDTAEEETAEEETAEEKTAEEEPAEDESAEEEPAGDAQED